MGAEDLSVADIMFLIHTGLQPGGKLAYWRCHGLAPWSLTLDATPILLTPKLDATGLPRGGSRSQLNSRDRETPRGKPVASGEWALDSV